MILRMLYYFDAKEPPYDTLPSDCIFCFAYEIALASVTNATLLNKLLYNWIESAFIGGVEL